MTEHTYPSSYGPGQGVPEVDAAWEILDIINPGVIPHDARALLAGIITGTLQRMKGEHKRASADMLAALKLARRSMIVSVTGVSDGLTIHDIRQWIEQADAAIAKAESAS